MNKILFLFSFFFFVYSIFLILNLFAMFVKLTVYVYWKNIIFKFKIIVKNNDPSIPL